MTTGTAEFTLYDTLVEHRRSRPEELAVVDGEVRLTFRELADRVEHLADALEARRVGAGDRMLWLGLNSFRILEISLAASRIGASVCPVNWRQSEAETEFVVDDIDPSLVFWQSGEDLRWDVDRLRAHRPLQLWVSCNGSAPDYEHLLTEEPTHPAPEARAASVDPSLTALILYTAAHDGTPNGAQITSRGLFTASVIHGIVNGTFDERPCFLAQGPLFHVATFMGVTATFLAGGTVVFLPKVAVPDACTAIERERCTWAYITGPTISEMATYASGHDLSLSSLLVPPAYVSADGRWANLGRVATSPWARNAGAFGQTETSGVLSYAALAGEAIGRAGRPSPFCHIRVVDGAGGDAPIGEVGEIVARGPLVGNGYWNRPDLNRVRLVDGWWHTNDLGRREPDGSLTFVGPKTRMIKTGKENVYPAEVERCLMSHPDVVDAAVIGVADPDWEQAVKAIVVAKQGSGLSEAEVIRHCRTEMASYKKPRFVEFAESLPRHGFALDRDELDRRFGGGGYIGVDSGS